MPPALDGAAPSRPWLRVSILVRTTGRGKGAAVADVILDLPRLNWCRVSFDISRHLLRVRSRSSSSRRTSHSSLPRLPSPAHATRHSFPNRVDKDGGRVFFYQGLASRDPGLGSRLGVVLQVAVSLVRLSAERPSTACWPARIAATPAPGHTWLPYGPRSLFPLRPLTPLLFSARTRKH